MNTDETTRVREIQDKHAGGYDRQMGFFEKLLFADGREWACGQVEGEVLEIAVGTGRNLPHYARGVRLTGIELSPRMLELGERRARDLGISADLMLGDAQTLEFADEKFDTVLITFALCTIPDDRRALSEAIRVLRPGGKLVLLEHVRSPAKSVSFFQRAIEPLSVRFGADHLTREPLDYLEAVGFEVQSVRRFKAGIVERVIARKPD
ncbi:MAG: class I SAM-dependent methyltransferase [Solirubrobacterales bacterium]